MADFIVGSPAMGEDFWFRKEFIENLWESLEKHNVLLIAPRRIGKTSVMYRMLEKPIHGWKPIHLNVEDIKMPSDFLITLIEAIREHQPAFFKEALAKSWDFLKGLLSTIEKVEAYEFKIQLRKKENLKENWQERANQLLQRIQASPDRILFIIDELPDMLNGMLESTATDYLPFLHWFRKAREASIKSNIRWIVGGSVNLVATLDKQGSVKLINDLKPEVLKPFTYEEVQTFASQMLQKEGVGYDDTVIPQIFELLGSPIPYFLQMFTQELHRTWKRNPSQTLTAETVNQIFNKTLLGEMARDKLQHYRTRLDIHYSLEDRETACLLLNNLSLSKNGISRRTLFNHYKKLDDQRPNPKKIDALNRAFQRLLLHLQSDFYIEEVKNERFDFASRLIKTWWKKYYGFECGGY